MEEEVGKRVKNGHREGDESAAAGGNDRRWFLCGGSYGGSYKRRI